MKKLTIIIILTLCFLIPSYATHANTNINVGTKTLSGKVIKKSIKKKVSKVIKKISQKPVKKKTTDKSIAKKNVKVLSTKTATSSTPTIATSSAIFSATDKTNYLNFLQADTNAKSIIKQAETANQDSDKIANVCDSSYQDQALLDYNVVKSDYQEALQQYTQFDSVAFAQLPVIRDYLALMESSINKSIDSINYSHVAASETLEALNYENYDLTDVSPCVQGNSQETIDWMDKATTAKKNSSDSSSEAVDLQNQATSLFTRLTVRAELLMPN